MQVWVDADACPGPVKALLEKTAVKREIRVTFVANRYIQTVRSPWLASVVVEAGFDVADNRIVEAAGDGDLVVTADVPLAAEVVAKGALAVTPRGAKFDANNVRERLAHRDMAQELRDVGQLRGGPPPYGKAELQQFANQLDRWVTQVQRNR